MASIVLREIVQIFYLDPEIPFPAQLDSQRMPHPELYKVAGTIEIEGGFDRIEQVLETIFSKYNSMDGVSFPGC